LSSSKSPNSTRPPSGAADRCGSLLGDELKRLERNSIGDHYRGGGCARGGGGGGSQGVMLANGGGDGVVAVVVVGGGCCRCLRCWLRKWLHMSGGGGWWWKWCLEEREKRGRARVRQVNPRQTRVTTRAKTPKSPKHPPKTF